MDAAAVEVDAAFGDDEAAVGAEAVGLCFDGDVAELDDASVGDFEGVEGEVVAGEFTGFGFGDGDGGEWEGGVGDGEEGGAGSGVMRCDDA